MKYFLGFAVIMAFFVSCGDGGEADKDVEFYETDVPNADVLRVGIKDLEDSLMLLSEDQTADRTLTNLVQQAYVEKLKLMYRMYPEDKDAAHSLRKVYMMYSAMGAPELSVKYADSLVEKYPKYEEGWLALQSNAMYYDMEAKPRDKEKVRYYLEKLLKDYPNLDPQIIEQVKSRLETIDLTFEELIQQNNPS
ncbi:MAG: hypothetical protein HWE22_14085 [Flavobacteriales bacterium]|nr:hypothetical protein [Flavobacteriales bacterium]